MKVVQYEELAGWCYVLMEDKNIKTLSDVYEDKEVIDFENLMTLFVSYMNFLEGCILQGLTPKDSHFRDNILISKEDENIFNFICYGVCEENLNLKYILDSLATVLEMSVYNKINYDSDYHKSLFLKTILEIQKKIVSLPSLLDEKQSLSEAKKKDIVLQALLEYKATLINFKESIQNTQGQIENISNFQLLPYYEPANLIEKILLTQKVYSYA